MSVVCKVKTNITDELDFPKCDFQGAHVLPRIPRCSCISTYVVEKHVCVWAHACVFAVTIQVNQGKSRQ